MRVSSVRGLGGLLMGVGGLCLVGCGGDSEADDAADAMSGMDLATDAVSGDAAVGMDGMPAPADSAHPDASLVDGASTPDSAGNDLI